MKFVLALERYWEILVRWIVRIVWRKSLFSLVSTLSIKMNFFRLEKWKVLIVIAKCLKAWKIINRCNERDFINTRKRYGRKLNRGLGVSAHPAPAMELSGAIFQFWESFRVLLKCNVTVELLMQWIFPLYNDSEKFSSPDTYTFFMTAIFRRG